MKIIALEVENIKHLKVVKIKPDGSLIIVGGDNAAGKTCVLDSIEYALNGAGAIPSKPIRIGQKKARVVLDMDDIQVIRTFTENGTNLTVKNKDGATFPSPQSMLDKLVGELAFDPLEFSRMDAKKQAKVLKKLVGLDFDAADIQYKQLFDQRTIINRRGKSLKSQLDGMIKYDDVPDREVSVQQLSKEYTKSIDYNRDLEVAERGLKSDLDKIEELKKQIAALTENVKQKQKIISGAKKIDTQAIQAKMAEAESINAKIRDNIAYTVIDQELVELRKKSGSLSSQMTKIIDKKAHSLSEAKFPIKGLAIDDNGVTFDGVPLVQCSSSQQIKISVAIGLAMNPKLRVLLIREGSLLDEKNLEMIAKMAADSDAQVWLEKVSKGKECSVIIEDGSVLE